MMDKRQPEILAARLLEAERERRPLASQGEADGLDEEAAYQVQDLLIELRGERPVGYKLGFTSEAMREQMSIASPNYGRLGVSMELGEPLLDLGELIHPKLEPEIALFVEHDLDGSDITRSDVTRAVRWASAAIEVVDSRFHGYRFTAAENTADNSSAARFLLGEQRRLHSLEPRLVGALLTRNGQIRGTGIGANAMGSPLHAVHWLCQRLAQQGRMLEAGSMVLTGGLTRAIAARCNDTFVIEFAGLGTLTLHCSGRPAEAS